MKSVRNDVKEANPEFYDEIIGLGKEQLDARVVQLVKDLAEVAQSQEDDQQLQDLKQQARDAGAPYREAKKAINKKVSLILELLSEKA